MMVGKKGGAVQQDEPSAVTEPEPGALEAQIESLGESIRANEGATGGLDISEEGHRTAISAMEQMGDDLVLDPVSLVPDVRDFLLDIIKSRPKPWSATSPGEQRDVAAACEQLAEGMVRRIIEVIRSDGKDPVRVLLQKVTLGDEIQITGRVKTFDAEEEDKAVSLLHHARGKHVMLTVASLDDYKGHRPAETDEEEPALPFAGDDHPDDDSDLVEAAEGPTIARTGDGIDLDRHGQCEIRVSIKTGMVEALPDREDSETGWIDVREATAAELAAERDRVADFDTGEAATAAKEEATAEA